MSDTHTKTDLNVRIQAMREVRGMFGDLANLIGRICGVFDRLLDELETLADDPDPDPDPDPETYSF